MMALLSARRRPVDAWLLHPAMCSDRDRAHPAHTWESVVWEFDDPEPFWCRGRIPFTAEAANDGANWVTSLREAEAWAEMCSRTPAGRQFLNSPGWRRRHAELRAAEEQSRAERRATPLLVRLWRRLP